MAVVEGGKYRRNLAGEERVFASAGVFDGSEAGEEVLELGTYRLPFD